MIWLRPRKGAEAACRGAAGHKSIDQRSFTHFAVLIAYERVHMKTHAIFASAVAAALSSCSVPATAQTTPGTGSTDPSSDWAPTAATAAPRSGTPVATTGTPAGNYGTVVSATPITSQVRVREQRCFDQPGEVRAQPSGLGAVAGAVLGGLAGNTIGAGGGRALATGVGVVGGAIAGHAIEQASAPTVPVTTTQCDDPETTVSRIVGYDVVYDFNGQRFTTRTQQDPGARIALDVRPAATMPGPAASTVATTIVSPYPIDPYAPVYPAYVYPAPVYVGPPVRIGLGLHARWH